MLDDTILLAIIGSVSATFALIINHVLRQCSMCRSSCCGWKRKVEGKKGEDTSTSSDENEVKV